MGRERCQVAVFDVDGVLLEGDPMLGFRPRPLGVAILRELVEKGFRVYIVTGRPASRRGETLSQLREAGVPVERLAGLLMDERGAGEVASKLFNLERVLAKEGCIGEVHDDNPNVLSAIGRRAEALVLHGPWGCEAVRGQSVSRACGGSRPRRAHP